MMVGLVNRGFGESVNRLNELPIKRLNPSPDGNVKLMYRTSKHVNGFGVVD